jgi:NitT/TauT family transport system permease protein
MAGSLDLTGETGLERDRSDRDRDRERGIDAARYRRGAAGAAAFLAVWWAAARGQPTYLLPGPAEVLAALRAEIVSGALFVHLGQSLLHYLPGVAVGVVSGGALGIAMGWDKRLDDVLTPVTRVLRPIPPLAWIVFAIAWFGLGHLGAAFIVFIGAFWITFYSAYGGVETVPRTQMEAAASLGVDDDWALLRRVVVPDAAPQLLTGVRTSVGQCWMMVIAAELFGAPGIGYEIITSANNLAMDRSVAYMLTISAVFLLSDRLVRRLRARVVG